VPRYLQQIIVPDIGIEGQNKLQQARVLIIGAGGLGTPVACYLVACGINVGIVDGDKIELTNLHRQFLYAENEVGQLKVNVLSQKLKHQNPQCQIDSYKCFLDENNATQIINQYHLVCDCTDNVSTRILVDQLCGELNKPLVYAAVKDWEGYVTVLHHTQKIKLLDIFDTQDLLYNANNNCSMAGIVNTTCGIVGSIQATEVIKIILDLNEILDGKILCINSATLSFKTFKVKNTK